MNSAQVKFFVFPATVLMIFLLLSGCGGGYGKELKFNGGQLFIQLLYLRMLLKNLGTTLLRLEFLTVI